MATLRTIFFLIIVSFLHIEAFADFGFSPLPSEKCLIARTGENSFFWSYKKRGAQSKQVWRKVERDPNFQQKYQEAADREKDFDIPSEMVVVPSELKIEEISCLDVWFEYWRVMVVTTPKEDPTKPVFKLNRPQLEKSIIPLSDRSGGGTGFRISSNGYILTNVHVARIFCDVPEKLTAHMKVDCKNGYVLEAAGGDSKFENHDYVLLRKKDLQDDRTFLPICKEEACIGERIFTGGFPTATYSKKEYYDNNALKKNYPSSDSDEKRLSFSTGRISSRVEENNIGEQVLYFRSGFPTEEQICNWGGRSAFASWDQNLRSYLSDFRLAAWHGSSGSPILNTSGQVIGILNSTGGKGGVLDINFFPMAVVIKELDLCNTSKSSDPDRIELANQLRAQGHC